ncbi:hypothetical protein [Dyadobacter diqingensis]|uniref:hypothetical protein n=1 Tax=Dyadobacter diqingensis TaxID=2938121 RepID=UPI0020C5137C|nr:hypothetical protein [Dyadobacter diqingensis]
MEIKQLKANYQLAELRYNSDKSEANTAILKQAKKEYEAALKPVKAEPVKSDAANAVDEIQKQTKKQLEAIKSIGSANVRISPKTASPKIEPLSGENENSDELAGTETNGDASGEQQDIPEDTTNSGEPAVEEKKTEVIP